MIICLFRRSPTGAVLSRSEEGVIATVQINFKAGADISSEKVLTQIKEYTETCGDCPLSGATFTGKFTYYVCPMSV